MGLGRCDECRSGHRITVSFSLPRRCDAGNYGSTVRPEAVVRAMDANDAGSMSLLDTSPGGFIAVANCILYATVGVECWMLTTGSLVAMVGVLTLVITLAALLCGWAMRLMGPESVPDYEPQPSLPPVAATAAPVAREARLTHTPVVH